MESAEFKDWQVYKDEIGAFLCHYCYGLKKDYFAFCKRKTESKDWFCSNCRTIVPKELQVFADLCYCEPFSGIGNFVNGVGLSDE